MNIAACSPRAMAAATNWKMNSALAGAGRAQHQHAGALLDAAAQQVVELR